MKLLEMDRENLEITLVDKSSHFEFICSNYKSLCDEATFQELAEPFENVVKSFECCSSGKPRYPVKFVQGRLEGVDYKKNEVVVSRQRPRPASYNVRVQALRDWAVFDYDALVICTGSNYHSPWREAPHQ